MPLGKLGKYERVDVLGHGASGIVYLAWDTLLKKQVALKEIDLQSADVSRFLEEARVMDRLNHPNIVRVNGVDKIDGHILIDMEYVKGRNLQQLLREVGRLPVEQALDIAIEMLDALDYAHTMRTVHRDIKPANVLVAMTGGNVSNGSNGSGGAHPVVKLVDFGLAEILATNSYAGGAGTYAYMAPEDFSEEHHSDHQSDIWAAGVTLYEMLTGARPFNVAKPKDPFAWRRALLNDAPTPLSAHFEQSDETLEGLQAVLDRAFARDKAARYRTAGQFRDDLKAIREGRAPATMPMVTEAERRALFGTPSANGHAVTNGTPPVAAPPRYDEATVNEATVRRGLGLWRRPALPARVAVEPDAIHFGELRKGDDRALRVQVRFDGGDGRVSGQVVGQPPWATVYPPTITRRRQTLTVTAHSGRVWETGQYEDSIRLQTSAGAAEVPVTLRVLKPRKTFAEVGAWYLPMLFSTLLPAGTLAWAAAGSLPGAHLLIPAAALGSGLLAAMALLVSVEADLGFGEKMACGVLLAVMTMVLGITVGVSGRTHDAASLARLPATGVPMGLLLVAQLAQRRYWKFWTTTIVLLAILTSFVFAAALAP